MDFLIAMLALFNLVVGTTLLVVEMASMDRRYAQRVRDEEKYKSHFRNRDRDDQ